MEFVRQRDIEFSNGRVILATLIANRRREVLPELTTPESLGGKEGEKDKLLPHYGYCNPRGIACSLGLRECIVKSLRESLH
jgi:hypothetical protein